MENKKAAAIHTIGVLEIIGGVFLGIILGFAIPEITISGTYIARTEETFNWSLAITIIAISAVNGLLFIGFAEIINLLHKQNMILDKNENEDRDKDKSIETTFDENDYEELPTL